MSIRFSFFSSKNLSWRLGGGFICLLTTLAGLAQTDSAEINPPSELEKVLADMMRRDLIDHTRPAYFSSTQWGTHCNAFYGPADKTWCEEKRQTAANGEVRLRALLKASSLDKQARRQGWLTLYMPIGFFDSLKEGSLTSNWLGTLKDLLTGHSPQGTARCAQEYPCAVVFRLDKADLRLLDIDVIALRP